ncbi:MAG: hypothetical protein A2Z15_02695 [Chloroflexi bacterium RBG_16_50_11]|nr:MAG: hypothetical protein A2Z15_02695 [Chloroflexi bacterium RBG_16_50_11]
MHDNIAVIEQEPAGVGTTLAVMRQGTFFFQGFFDFFADGVYLPGAIAGTDNKIVRETTQFTDIQQDDIARLLIAGDFYSFTG